MTKLPIFVTVMSDKPSTLARENLLAQGGVRGGGGGGGDAPAVAPMGAGLRRSASKSGRQPKAARVSSEGAMNAFTT